MSDTPTPPPQMPMPPMPRGLRTPRGALTFGILALLAETPQTGYALTQTFPARTHGRIRPESGSVYPALRNLATRGLVTEGAGGVYSITQDGEYELAKQGSHWAHFFARDLQHPGAELIQALQQLMPAVQHLMTQGSAEQQAAIVAQLQGLRRDIYRQLGS